MAGTIICYGDSNTFGYDPAETLTMRYPEGVYWTSILDAETDFDVENQGECGREIPHRESDIAFMCRQVESWRKRRHPVRLLIMLGSNDLIQIPHAAAEDVGDRMETFLRALMETDAVQSGDVMLTLVSPPLFHYGTWVPKEWMYRESRRIDGIYRDLAGKLGLSFISAASWDLPVVFDGVHLSEEAHRSFASHIIEVLGAAPALC